MSSRDFVAIAIAYAERAVNGDKSFGKWSRLACARFLRDLQRTNKPNPPFVFSHEHANDACAFIELLPHVEGTWDTVNITLHPAHIFATVNIFGFRNHDGTRRFSSALFAVARKNAKALALDTPLPTPTGWTTMGDVKIGDQLFSSNGRVCKVTGVSEIYEDHDCYKITFSNNDEVIADAGHLWPTIVKTVTTEQWRDKPQFALRLPKPLLGNQANAALTPTPYSYGVWLSSHVYNKRKGNFGWFMLLGDKAYEHITQRMASEGCIVTNRCISEEALSVFTALGTTIPPEYLRADFATRLALLQGIADAAGWSCADDQVVRIAARSDEFAKSLRELLHTLGIVDTATHSASTNLHHVNYEVVATVPAKKIAVFSTPKKLKHLLRHSKHNEDKVYARSIERVPSVPVRCIMVNSPDHTFLFGKTMLPTHNSTWAAGVLLYCQMCENEEGPQVISAATTGSQARIIFEIARKMALKSADFREYFDISVRSNDIQSHFNNGIFKPINAKASSQDGLNPSATGIDEVHAHKTHDLLNVLKSAAGARQNPLFLYTTTEGYESPGPWPELRHFSKQVLQDVLVADHFFCILYCLDTEDSEFDPDVWIKANPLMDANPLLAKEIAKEAVEAKQMPGKHAEFKIKRCNRQSAVADGFIDIVKWDQRCDPFAEDSLIGMPCYAALDLASTRDLCSLRLTFFPEDGRVLTIGRRWAPEAAIHQRTERGTSNYAGWVQAGILLQTPGDVTDYDFIEKEIDVLHEKFNIHTLAYDKWNAGDLINRLVAKKMNCREFIQGTKSYHPAMRALERAYISGKLYHNGDPLLKWCASNLVVRYDSNMNCAPDRKKSADKIDDVAALIMSMGAHLADNPEPVAEPKVFFV